MPQEAPLNDGLQNTTAGTGCKRQGFAWAAEGVHWLAAVLMEALIAVGSICPGPPDISEPLMEQGWGRL